MDFLELENCVSDFRQAVNLVRDGTRRILVLGFPIPKKVGDHPALMHWQPLHLPVVSGGKQHQNGFRPNELGHWMRDMRKVFTRSRRLEWQDAENWSLEANTRGQFGEGLRRKKVLLIGAGAVGSIFGELLVRAGVTNIEVWDGQCVEYGNLCRHILTLEDIGFNKAQRLAKRLNALSGQGNVVGIDRDFLRGTHLLPAHTDDCEVVIDCTGEDETIRKLERHSWGKEMLFCSLSLSFEAKRIYIYTWSGECLDIEEFRERFKPWAEKDLAAFGERRMWPTGIGCWHLAFPARNDSISILTSAAVRRLEEAVENQESSPRLVVYEQLIRDGQFHGISRVDS